MKNKRQKSPRARIMGALFAEASKRGIDDDHIRKVLAPEVIGKRLSDASGFEIGKVLDAITGVKKPQKKKYESSLKGLIDEIVDLAVERFGDDEWQRSLKSLCRCFGCSHYNWLDMWHAKEVKKALIRLQKKGPWKGNQDAD